MDIVDTFAFLLGDWSLERTLVDHRAGVRATFVGTVRLRPSPAPPLSARQAHYEERGRLRYGNHEGPAFRTLEYLRRDSGAVAVTFSDGRPFFSLDLGSGTCRADHPCGEDLYELRFEVGTNALVREHWRVVGPRKDYEAVADWRRLSAPAS